jgi:hypothetical protein
MRPFDKECKHYMRKKMKMLGPTHLRAGLDSLVDCRSFAVCHNAVKDSEHSKSKLQHGFSCHQRPATGLVLESFVSVELVKFGWNLS